MKNKEMEYFRAGMERAYRIMKDDGPEKEIDTGIDDIKRITIETALTMAAGVLYSEFGFGKKRIERFRDVFMEATDSLNKGIVTWADICYNIEDLTGVHLRLVDDLGRDTGMIREV